MYTDPVIVYDEKKHSRSYVKFYYKGVRFRYYNGRKIGIKCTPNEAKTTADRMRLLGRLQHELRKKLEGGWQPPIDPEQGDPFQGITLEGCLTPISSQIQKESISDSYRADLIRVCNELNQYLINLNLHDQRRDQITSALLNRFLEQFNTSAAYYMIKRRTLSGLFFRMVAYGLFQENLVQKTVRKKEVHLLNVAFSQPQLKAILEYLSTVQPALHLVGILMYGSFLRPHREIRLLQRRHLNEDCTKITLSGSENKSKRIRVIHLPPYVTNALLAYGIASLEPTANILSKTSEPLNKNYLTTLWTRLKKEFPPAAALWQGQTLYSFRHTGAVAVYHKTKDPYRVQQAMFHNSLNVTLTYLRSLGLLSTTQAEDLPDL